jgi:[ribosomal protein S18]-alanine N-acetyltransferase
MRIRQFTPEDLPAIAEIQKQVLPAGGWAEADYLRLLQTGGLILLAEPSEGGASTVGGYAVAIQTEGEAEILSLAVAEAYQRKGIGRELLKQICAELRRRGVRRAYLEVRASNRAAIELYASVGFRLHHVRPNYYHQPIEDAYVMALELPV